MGVTADDGDGLYEVARWDEPDPPNDHTAYAESGSLRWILLDRSSGAHVGYFRDQQLARRVAVLLNSAHRGERAP